MLSKRELNTNMSSWILQVGEELVQGQGRLQQMVEKLGEETKVSYLHQNPCKRIFSKKQLQEVEEHVKLLTSKETELAEAIERLEAEGEVMLQIH